jgi:tetratricopeptide (TPR) repeat protein
LTKELAKAMPGASPGGPGKNLGPKAKVIDESAQQLQFAKELGEQAQKALTAAQTEPNAQVARVYLKDAEIKAESARGIVERVQTGLGMTTRNEPPGPLTAASGHGLDPGGGLALFQLKVANGLADKAFGASPVYDAGLTYDPAAGQVTDSHGRVVDVRPLISAVQTVTGATAAVFEPVKAPGEPPTWRLTESAQAALSSSESRSRLDNVGGVELQVTLDLLGFLGVPDFRKPGPAAVVDAPVMVSLAELARRASRYAATSQWADLPEDVRYPGEIERVHGFVFDRSGRDIFLVGAKARSRATRIDLDSLIVALRSVWIEGQTPGVSLDPFPDDPGGPQYARVMGVPTTSTFARIMLDADYAMKRIMCGRLTVSAPQYQTYAALVAARHPSNSLNRFWFYPAPLGPHDAHISGTGRSILYDSSLRVLTETERIVAGGLAGTGTTDETGSRAAELFTSALDSFERSSQVEPQGVFLRLHGLVDLVTVCKIWRDMELDHDHPVLKALSALPVNKPEGRDSVPTYYPGLTVEVWEDATRVHFISGGVLARARATNRSFDRYQDFVSRSLEAAADSFPYGHVAQALPIQFTLPRAGSETDDQAERLVLAGQAQVDEGHYDLARGSFERATAANPFHADAWAYLAQTECQLGNYRAAARAAAKAVALEPMDSTIRMTALDVELKADPQIDLTAQDPSILRALSEEYGLRGFAALTEDDKAEAKHDAETAIRLWDNNGVAYVVHAWTWPDPAGADAKQDWSEAIRAFRKLSRTQSSEETAGPLALALGTRASLRVRNISKQTDFSHFNADDAPALLDDLQRAINEAEEARELYPSQPLAITLEAFSRALRVVLWRAAGRGGDLTKARQLADQAVHDFPDFPPAHFIRGFVLLVGEDHEGATLELTEAIRLDPTHTAYYEQRGELELEAHRCGVARADLQQIRKRGGHPSSTLEGDVARCTP